MKTRLIDFDLAKAQAGAKVVTRAQEPVRILCYDRVDNRDTKYPIVALVTMMSETFENPHDYTLKGEWNALKGKTYYDLMIEEPEYEDADKKCIEELSGKRHKFKPFERVLVRDNCSDKWRANIFQAYDKDSSGNIFYRCINGVYRLCIPYEGNEEWVNTDKTLKFEY